PQSHRRRPGCRTPPQTNPTPCPSFPPSLPRNAACSGSGGRQGCDYLVGHEPHQLLHVIRFRGVAICACGYRTLLALAGMNRRGLGVAPAERVVTAQVAVLPAVEADVVVTEPLLKIEQLLRLPLGEVIDVSQLAGQDQDLAVGVDDLAVPVGLFQ